MGCFGKDVKNKARGSSAQRIAIVRTSLYLLLITPLIASCASNQIGPTRPISIDYDVALVWPLAYPQDLTAFNSASGRNEILTARMYIADMEYHTYEARLTREMQDEGILATAVNLGLTTSATLVPLAQTKTLLSGIATGVTGLDKAFDEKELLSNTIQALQTQMRADRKTQAAEIYAKMFKDAGHNTKTITPIAEYTLPMALSDADAYYQAGTVASSLIGLSKTVANAETNADQAKAAKGPNPRAVLDSKAISTPGVKFVPSVIVPPARAQFVAPLPSPSTRLPKPEPPPSNPEAINSFEKKLPIETVKQIQAALCHASTGHLDASTRQAVVDFFSGAGQDRSDIITKGILSRDMSLLEQAIQEVRDCKKQGFEGPKSVGRSLH